MARLTQRLTLHAPVDKVWRTLTDVQAYTWRSDLRATRVADEAHFTEITHSGYETSFVITDSQPCRRWAFTMENGNMRGAWVGALAGHGEDTLLQITETVTARHLWMKPFVRPYLKRQQARFAADLTRALHG